MQLGGVFAVVYERADDQARMVLCAPVLMKRGGVYEVAVIEKLQRTKVLDEDLLKVAFQISYRGAVLQSLAKSHDSTSVQLAWLLSAEDRSRASYDDVEQKCVTLYNALRLSGRIPLSAETPVVTKLRERFTATFQPE